MGPSQYSNLIKELPIQEHHIVLGELLRKEVTNGNSIKKNDDINLRKTKSSSFLKNFKKKSKNGKYDRILIIKTNMLYETHYLFYNYFRLSFFFSY